MGGLRMSNDVLLAKTETVYGTDSVPVAGTNAILVRNVSMQPEGLRMNDREAVRGGLGRLQRGYGGSLKRITFECEVKGSGTAGTVPEIGPLIEACGFDETVVAATSVTYTPEDGAHESISIYWFEGGRKRHILTGCRGTCTFRTEAGGYLIAAFEFVGHHSEPTDQSQPTPTYNSTVPRTALGMAIALNGVSAIIARSWQWTLNNTLALPPSLAATDGYGDVILTARDITGDVVIESELDSIIDVDALLSSGTRFAFASGLQGSVPGNRVQISTPANSTYVTDQQVDQADGLRLRRVPLAIDDAISANFSVTFT